MGNRSYTRLGKCPGCPDSLSRFSWSCGKNAYGRSLQDHAIIPLDVMRATTEHPERSPAPTGEVIARLKEAYPDARTDLRWQDPLQLLVATILSAQGTDV